MPTEQHTIRLSLDVSPELNAKIEQMAQDIKGTKSSVLRKALALLDVAIQASKQNRKIGILRDDATDVTEIIGLTEM